jgi:hypothetical protein
MWIARFNLAVFEFMATDATLSHLVLIQGVVRHGVQGAMAVQATGTGHTVFGLGASTMNGILPFIRDLIVTIGTTRDDFRAALRVATKLFGKCDVCRGELRGEMGIETPSQMALDAFDFRVRVILIQFLPQGENILVTDFARRLGIDAWSDDPLVVQCLVLGSQRCQWHCDR